MDDFKFIHEILGFLDRGVGFFFQFIQVWWFLRAHKSSNLGLDRLEGVSVTQWR